MLSVAICTYNQADRLLHTLERLTRIEPPSSPWELVVVDNRCTDHTARIIEGFTGRLPLRTVFEPTRGISHARNTAVRHVRGTYVVWTEDTALVDAGWLRAYERAIARWPEVAVLGGPIHATLEGTPPPWWQAAADEPAVRRAFGVLDLGPEEAALDGDDRSPLGANFAVRGREQRQFDFTPALEQNPRAAGLGPEIAIVRAILAAGGTGAWVPDARVERSIPREHQTVAYLRSCYTRRGRELARLDRGSRRGFRGHPRWMWRKWCESELTYRVMRLTGNPHRWVNPLVSAATLWGVVSTAPPRGTAGVVAPPAVPTSSRLDRFRRALSRSWNRARVHGADANLLIAAVRRNDVRRISELLARGAAVDARDARGRSPLHLAVACGHADSAALLLAHGADPGAVDGRGRLACHADTPRDLLHAIRQRYHRLPARSTCAPPSAHATGWAAELQQHGIVRISGLVSPGMLADLRQDFGAFMHTIEERIARGSGVHEHYDEEEHWWPDDQAFVSNNAFKYSAQLVRLCCHPDLLATVRAYLGREAFVTRGVAMRYLPAASRDNDMFGWHHDMEERRFKMMVLLTDVLPGGQHMSYVRGSHMLFHPYPMFLRSTCGLDYCRRHLGSTDIYDAVGTAGDIFLFDSNGAHRGNRAPGAATRDAFFIEYGTGQAALWGSDVDARIRDEVAGADRHPFAKLVSAPKRWLLPKTRQAPSWVEDLPHVDRWLLREVVRI